MISMHASCMCNATVLYGAGAGAAESGNPAAYCLASSPWPCSYSITGGLCRHLDVNLDLRPPRA
jgi:hypothetical protein